MDSVDTYKDVVLNNKQGTDAFYLTKYVQISSVKYDCYILFWYQAIPLIVLANVFL